MDFQTRPDTPQQILATFNLPSPSTNGGPPMGRMEQILLHGRLQVINTNIQIARAKYGNCQHPAS